jgi:hypothetical protein
MRCVYGCGWRRFAAQLTADGPTVNGSKGQIRPHPLLSVEQNLSRNIRSAFGQLRLSPDKRPSWNVEISAAGRIVRDLGSARTSRTPRAW